MNVSKQMLAEGKVSEALSMLEGSLKIYDSHMAHRYMGEIYLKMKDTQKALYHFNRVYREFSFDPKFLTDLILLYISLDEFQRAADLFNELKR